MSKNVIVLVGHCGPDSSFLRMAVSSADRTAQVVMADDPAELNQALKAGVHLVLLNRELGYGFDGQMGVDLVKHLRQTHPHVKTMLVRNYPDAQAAAVANGALPGFGKREIGSPRVPQLIREALTAGADVPASKAS
jgi:hypothetical protein